jgi:hypothetical protein
MCYLSCLKEINYTTDAASYSRCCLVGSTKLTGYRGKEKAIFRCSRTVLLKRLIDFQAADIKPHITERISQHPVHFYQIRD